MDIDFIQLEHRENVLKLMQICGVDMKQAYELYTDSGYNFEAAVNRKFNPIQAQPNIPPEIPPQINHHGGFDPYGQGQFPPEYGLDYEDDDIEYTQYKQFRHSGKSFDSKYPVRPKQSFFKSIIPKFFKSKNNDSFPGKLDEYLGRHVNLKADEGNLSESFNWCWKQKFPIAVILLDFSHNALPIAKKFFFEDVLIEKVISEQFKAYGINTKEYDLQPELKPFFNFERDANSVVILRVNHLDQINVITRISLNEPIDQIKKKVKQAKSSCIQNELDQSHIAKQFNEERRGNFNYQRPKTIKESIKARQDKKLRKQQEQAFFEACQPKAKPEQKVQPQKQEIKPPFKHNQQPPRKQEIKPEVRPQYQSEVKPEVKSEIKPSISADKIKIDREAKLSKMKKYTSGVMFKIRCPSGSNIMLTVDPEEFIQYIFDFVDSQPEELGFADELLRKFDIYIGFGGSETLRGKERKKIKEVFEDSEVLIVREL